MRGYGHALNGSLGNHSRFLNMRHPLAPLILRDILRGRRCHPRSIDGGMKAPPHSWKSQSWDWVAGVRPAPTAHTERPPTGQARRRAEDTYTVGASVAAPATKALSAAIWGAGSLYYTEGIIFPENFVRVFEMGVL